MKHVLVMESPVGPLTLAEKDGALTEVAVWEGFNASSPWSCGLYLAGDELVNRSSIP